MEKFKNFVSKTLNAIKVFFVGDPIALGCQRFTSEEIARMMKEPLPPEKLGTSPFAKTLGIILHGDDSDPLRHY